MDIPSFFESVENELLARLAKAGFVAHAGDKGGNREEILRDFLSKHLPARYGVAKGEIATKAGQRSHSADIIIYDALDTPILYSESTAVLPIEGVYGIIEVKSRLSKTEFLDAASKITEFKRLAPRDLSVISTRDYVTVHRPSRPFGLILGYQLDGNSLASLAGNWAEENKRVHDVNFFVNAIAVLGTGVLNYELIDLPAGTKEVILHTDTFVNTIRTAEHATSQGLPVPERLFRIAQHALGNRTFGRFYVYLLLLLSGIRLGVPDLGAYLDPELPRLIFKES
jgi:hypothetical protein